MSKSDLDHELLQDQLKPGNDHSTQRPSEVLAKTNRDRDSVTPFAKDMVDDVVTGALSILDISRKEGKPWKEVLSSSSKNPPEFLSCSHDIPSVNKNIADSLQQDNQTPDSFSSAGTQRPVVQVMHLRLSDDVVCNSVHAEQVAKIVKGLQDIQIGDSTYVLPVNGSNIERQVKRAARNINNLELGDMETAQLIICDGQGDVRASILEGELGPPSNANIKPQHDGSKVSTCVLHKMIEELEVDDSTKGNSPDHRNKEGIASWEESEEQLMRIIEGPDDERSPTLLEYQEYRHPEIYEQESMALGAGNDSANRTSQDSLDHTQQAFSKEEIIDCRNNGKQPRDRLDNYEDEDPYWCTAGLITRVVTTPQHGDVSLSKTTMAGKDSITSGLDGNLQTRCPDTSFIRESLSVMEHAEKKTETKDKRSKLLSKKKTSLGRRLRKFFSRFKRNRNC